MQSTSELYKQLLANPHSVFDWRVVVNDDAVIGITGIYDGSITGSLFAAGTPSVGGCVARELDITLIPGVVEIPRMAKLRVEFSLTYGEQQSEWIPAGVFFIDTRAWNAQHDMVTIHGYDAMLKGEVQFIPTGEESGTWPRRHEVIVAEIAERLGVTLHERTIINPDYNAEYPSDFTIREMLGFIAGCHCGNWTITPDNKLLLIPLVPANPTVHDIGQRVYDFENSAPFDAWTKVQFYYSDKNTFASGSDEGRVLEIECPWASQEIADNALVIVQGQSYAPYIATGAVLDPAAELGDYANVNGTESIIADYSAGFGSVWSADIAAPSEEEIDHEYPYESKIRRETQREFSKLNAAITVGFDEITLRVKNNEDDISTLQQTADGIQLTVENQGGEIALLQQTASEIEQSVQNAEGEISQLQQTAGQVSVTVSDQKGTLGTYIDADSWEAKYNSEDGITESGFYFDFELGRFVFNGTGVFTSEEGTTYITVENDEFVLYSSEGASEALDKVRIGYITGPSPDESRNVDYPYIKLGSAGSYSVGLFKKFWNGLWVGNSAPLDLTGNFEGCDGAAGIFINTTTGKTYVVNGTDMQNIYTGEAIAKFA